MDKDKRVMFAVAGAGKTTYIIDQLQQQEGKRALVVTYTDTNYNRLKKLIEDKYGGNIPGSIVLMTYFRFVYSFCYKPFLADIVNAKGMIFKPNPNQYAKKDDPKYGYYMSSDRYIYSNRLAFLVETYAIDDVRARIEKYFDVFFIDEVQDIAGRDFNFLKELMLMNVNMLFVGDFYQHTFDTSLDGNVNKNLFKDYKKYKKIILAQGVQIDTETKKNSQRCSGNVCKFVTERLGIDIGSDKEVNTSIEFVSDQTKIRDILNDPGITKLHYNKSSKFGAGHVNWGDSKGEEFNEVCVILNSTAESFLDGEKLKNGFSEHTRNKLYVALTRTKGDCYLVREKDFKKVLNSIHPQS